MLTKTSALDLPMTTIADPLERRAAAADPADRAGLRKDGLVAVAFLPVTVATIFLSAFLLFGVQPMFTKMVLPVLGGSPAVWSVAMVFFQALLLAGYAYAHALTRHAPLRIAAPLHLAVMACAFLTLPVGLATGWGKPPANGEAFWLLGLFLVSVGLPFFALAANGPLLQAWFARSDHPNARDPYFLYGASNIGSFSALIAYPIAIEPLLALQMQSRWWMAGFALLAVLIGCCATIAGRRTSARPVSVGQAGGGAAPASGVPPRVIRRERLTWIALSFVPSGLLISVTAHISTDIASAPLLWVAPLALFLLTFVLAFRERPIASPLVLGCLQVFGTALALLPRNSVAPLAIGLSVHLGLFLVNALVCHGALYRRRPPADRLTEFYLCLSLGGVLGGIFCGLVAPRVFSTVLEYPILLLAALLCRPGLLDGSARWRVGLSVCAVIAIAVLPIFWLAQAILPPQWVLFSLIAPAVVAMTAFWHRPECVVPLAIALATVLAGSQGSLGGSTSSRSFFGVHKIATSADGRFRTLSHGTTLHGAIRILNDDDTPVSGRPEPTTYYGPEAAIGSAIRAIRDAQGGRLSAVVAIGLGSGSLACHAGGDEAWTFLEIDPEVVRIASDPTLFRFLAACAPATPIVLGDARLTLAGQPGTQNLIVVDAFSSDAIPSHLMTREALGLYLSKLAPAGALIVHISNRHLELRHILARAATEHGLVAYVRQEKATEPLERRYRAPAIVVALARDPAHLGTLASGGAWTRIDPDPARRPWSDDFSNVVEAMMDRVR